MDNPNKMNWEPVLQYNGPEHEANRQIQICEYAISKHLHTYSIEKEKFKKSNDLAPFIEFLQSECINLERVKNNLLNHFLSYDEFPSTMESGKRKFGQLTLKVEKLRAELKELGIEENEELIEFLDSADRSRNNNLTPNRPLPNSSEIKKEFFSQIGQIEKNETVEFKDLLKDPLDEEIIMDLLLKNDFISKDNDKILWKPPSNGNDTSLKYMVALFLRLEDFKWLRPVRFLKNKTVFAFNDKFNTGYTAAGFGKWLNDRNHIQHIIEEYRFITKKE